jgi:peptidyl-prolyl cis-trans isomerase B (cyclophilin B)
MLIAAADTIMLSTVPAKPEGVSVAPSKNTEREAREARERLRRYNARQAVHAQQITRRKRDNLFAIGGVLVVAALATVTQVFYFNGGPGTPTPAPSISAETPAGQNVGDVPSPTLAENRLWTGTLTLNEIPLGVEFDGALAPQAVSSLLGDVAADYFTGKSCHRLVQTESAGLIQCGSLDGTGAVDPAYSFGPIENAAVDTLYPAGTIAMARAADDAYSNGHQFFIVFQDTVLPDDSVGGYSIVGTVTSGLDQLVAQIASAGIADGAADGPPVVPTTITGFTIE